MDNEEEPRSYLDELVKAQNRDMFLCLESMKDRGFEEFNIDPLITSFGVRVKVTEHGWVVLARQITNWRILDCRNDPFHENVPTAFSGWTRGWCYAEPSSTVTSLMAAVKWSGMPDTEPSGWVKSLPDGRRHGEPKDGITQE
jgi:hypothetical protein